MQAKELRVGSSKPFVFLHLIIGLFLRDLRAFPLGILEKKSCRLPTFGWHELCQRCKKTQMSNSPTRLRGARSSALFSHSEDSGTIEHLHDLSKDLGLLLGCAEISDVTFIVDDRRFDAHRVVLAARSRYFRALLYGGMKEAKPNAEIQLPYTSAEAFAYLLEYLYSGKLQLSKISEQVGCTRERERERERGGGGGLQIDPGGQ